MAVFTRCTHLKINGARCTAPAVYGKELCFEHESRLLRMRMRPTPPSTFATVPLVSFIYPEDHDCILENVHAIARSLAHGDIDYRIAGVMDRLMNTALRTLRQSMKVQETKETVRAFRLDQHGNPLAIADENEPVPEPQSAQTPEEPAGEISTITAEAEENPAEESPNPALRPKLNRAIPNLAQKGKAKHLFSNTCKFGEQNSNRSIRSLTQSAHQPNQHFECRNMA